MTGTDGRLDEIERRMAGAIAYVFESEGEAWYDDSSGDRLAVAAAGAVRHIVSGLLSELRDDRAEIHDIQRKHVTDSALAYHDRDEARAEAQSHWYDARAYQELYEQQVGALVKVEAELAEARAEIERLSKQMTGTVSMLAAERAKVAGYQHDCDRYRDRIAELEEAMQRVETFLTDAERGDKGRSRVVYCAGVRAALAGGDV